MEENGAATVVKYVARCIQDNGVVLTIGLFRNAQWHVSAGHCKVSSGCPSSCHFSIHKQCIVGAGILFRVRIVDGRVF
jgi:hypothetical protein